MSASETVTLTITQEDDYAFRVRFDGTEVPDLLTDEAPPIGRDRGPSPARLLGAAIGNCLGASLLFALRKYKNAPGALSADVRVEIARNDAGRLRIAGVAASLRLPEPSADYEHVDRALAQFENFCTVTESVRAGIPVTVSVTDPSGTVLHTSAAPA